MSTKNFFMAVMAATLEGRPQVRFNTVSGLTSGRNLTAKALEMIQESGAQMMQQSNVQFDNLVLDNIFWLGEMTDEEFMAGTSLAEQLGLTQAAEQAGELAADADASAEAQEAEGAEVINLQDEIQAKLAESVAADPSNVQAEEAAEAAAPEAPAEDDTKLPH